MKIIRFPEVRSLVGLSKVTIWRLERKGDFPRRLKLGPNSMGWLRDEVEAWIRDRAEARNIDMPGAGSARATALDANPWPAR